MHKKKILSGTGILIAAVLAIATIILVNSTLTSWRMDLTENKLYTLSEGTLNIIKSLEEPVTLDFYVSKKAMTGIPQIASYANRIHDLLIEYAAKSNGKIRLNVIEPEAFSEQEDMAVANGMQGAPINAVGDLAYFGLVGTSSTDHQQSIPFFQLNEEQKLEYDLTKLIYNIANPEKRTIGILNSHLPVYGDLMPQTVREWAISKLISEFFQVISLDSALEINDNLDLLLVIHPKDLSQLTLFAIDQYILAGGKAIFFVDPLAEGDISQPDPQNPNTIPNPSSELTQLFTAWGINVIDNTVAADLRSAMKVQIRTNRGIEEATYLPWLKLDKSNFNSDDIIASELSAINMGTAGIIEKMEGSRINLTPLFQTSAESMRLNAFMLQFERDPAKLLTDFISENTTFTLAARIEGPVTTSFPDGMPEPDHDNPYDDHFESPGSILVEGDINAIIVADTDILNDAFWISQQNYFGVSMPQPIADNGSFVINALENMSGSSDLISLRSRGQYSRPFKVVDEIRLNAETQFRQQQQMLETRLQETEQKIAALQQERSVNDLFLSTEQRDEIERFRQEQVNTRKELRAVQHELQKNIEQLGTTLKFINIGLIPLIITIMAISIGLIRTKRKSLEK